MADIARSQSLLQDLGLSHSHDDMDVDKPSGSGQQRLILASGFFDGEDIDDDDEMEDLFGPSPTKSNNRKRLERKKVPRRLSVPIVGEDDAAQPSPTKKPRITSLFGGPTKDPDDTEEAPPQTPGTRLGMRFSSLNLDQQEGQSDDDDDLVATSVDLDAMLERSQYDASPRLSPVLSDREETKRRGDSDVPAYTDDPVESYGLRRNINRQGATSTHIDVDHSGNYDPAEEARIKTLKARMAKQAKQATKKEKSKKSSDKPKDGWRPKLIFKRKIRAMGTVLNITDNQDNWPDGHSIIDPEDAAEREELLAFFRKDSPTPLCNLHISDPAGEYDDLTGHPAIRGCKQCRSDGNKCSMVTDGDYPCQECVCNNIECDALLGLGNSGPCKRCVEQGQTCSFENTNDEDEPQTAMCDECLEADYLDCKAISPRGHNRPRIDLQRDHYGQDRKWLSCTHCREEKKKCSLKKKTDKPPCKRCKRQKIGCHFYNIAPREKEKKSVYKEKDTDEELTVDEKFKDPRRTLLEEIAPEISIPGTDLFSPEDLAYMQAQSSDEESEAQEESDQDNELEIMEDTEGHSGILTTIKTSFAHPMVFSVESPGHPNAVLDCNFCKMPIFGMIGHFEQDVHVIQWSDGLGYTEFGNGHREGNDATTMCQQCTFHRLQIMTCSEHTIQPMDLVQDQLDYSIAVENLISIQGGTEEMQHELRRWCSLCFSLATHGCCTPQPSINADEDEVDPLMMDGCGFRLCGRCAQKFDQIYQNDLHSMATALDKEPKPTLAEADEEDSEGDLSDQGTVRADVGLLRVDGLLMKCVEASAAE